jgi:hypothetical protein
MRGTQTHPTDNEFAWRVHDGLSDWTARVDVKASIALAIEAAVLGFVVTLTGDKGVLAHVSSFQAVFLLAGLAALFIAVVLTVLVILPILRARRTKAEYKTNYIYFGHLRHWSADDLADALKSDPVGLPQLSRQLVVMSKLVWFKHRCLQVSLISFVIGILLIGFTLVLRGL